MAYQNNYSGLFASQCDYFVWTTLLNDFTVYCFYSKQFLPAKIFQQPITSDFETSVTGSPIKDRPDDSAAKSCSTYLQNLFIFYVTSRQTSIRYNNIGR